MSDFTMTRAALAGATNGRSSYGFSNATWRTMLRTYLTRKELAGLSSREMADVGLSSSAALAEAGRLPWDTIPGPRRTGSGIVGGMLRALERARTRRLISRLEARELRDFGVSPSDAQFEATKPFWRA